MRMMHKVLVVASIFLPGFLGLLSVPNSASAAVLSSQVGNNANNGTLVTIFTAATTSTSQVQRAGWKVVAKAESHLCSIDFRIGYNTSSSVANDYVSPTVWLQDGGTPANVANTGDLTGVLVLPGSASTTPSGFTSTSFTIPKTQFLALTTGTTASTSLTFPCRDLAPGDFFWFYFQDSWTSWHGSFGYQMRVYNSGAGGAAPVRTGAPIAPFQQSSFGTVNSVFWTSSATNGGTGPVYFQDSYVDTGASYPTLSNISPATGSTTLSTTVALGFDYNVNAATTMTGYLMSLVDKTVGSSQSYSGSIGTSGTIRRYPTLVSGHLYSLAAALTDNAGGTYSGLSSVFSVVATGTALSIYTASSTIYYDSHGNVITGSGASATSSLYYQGTNFNLSNVFPPGLNTALQTHFPFSYIYDAALLFSELGGGSATTTDASFTFPLGAQMSSGATSFTMINKSAIAAIPAVAQIRDMMTYVVYFTTAVYVIGAVMAAF